MSEFKTYVRQCLFKSSSKIRRLCLPLEEVLEIPLFGYFSVDIHGNYCNISNAMSALEYYYDNRLYEKDLYNCNPKFFQPGYKIIQQTNDNNSQHQFKERCQIDHMFQILYKYDNHIEGFIFGQRNKSHSHCIHFFDKIFILEKFIRYFKTEAKPIISYILEQGYNMKKALGKAFEEPIPQLTENSEKYSQFLKQIDLLSQRENQCVDLYKLGHSAQATAAKLGLSQRTVEHYLDNARLKFGFQSKREFLEI